MDADIVEAFKVSLTKLYESTANAPGWEALGNLGWFEFLREEPAIAIGLLFEIQGRLLGTTRALDAMVLDALKITPEVDCDAYLIGYPIPTRDAINSFAGEISSHHSDVVNIDVLVLGREREGSIVAVVVNDFDVRIVVTDSRRGLTWTELNSFDDSLYWSRVSGSVPATDVHRAGSDARNDWNSAVGRIQLAVAYEMMGVARTTLDMACEHARQRIQFGRPLGSFQAVKHRLAKAEVECSAAETALLSAAAELDEASSLAILVARIQCGIAATESAAHAQQIFGGMGYSWELPLHHYVKRAMQLDSLLGSTHQLARELGRRLATTRALPHRTAL